MKTINPLENFTAALALYAGLVAIVALVVRQGWLPGWELVLSFLLLAPGLLLFRTLQRSTAAMDEMQRRIQLEAFQMAYVGIFLLLVTETLLSTGGTPPSHPGTYIAFMAAMWLIGLGLARRKYE
ncbi:MAG: hypothetical protein KF701_04220 [Anaerolineales bacterium]|nr:MAG: hypothetical protein KF701_04220 [Anaerolineales bacterium]